LFVIKHGDIANKVQSICIHGKAVGRKIKVVPESIDWFHQCRVALL